MFNREKKYGYVRVIKYPKKDGKIVGRDVLQDDRIRVGCALLGLAGLKIFLEFWRLPKEKMRVNFEQYFFDL
jgi:hypothetical protein